MRSLLVTAQDHQSCPAGSVLTCASLCRGERVRLYKRAQIFVGDVWGAFQVRLLLTWSSLLPAVACSKMPAQPVKLQRDVRAWVSCMALVDPPPSQAVRRSEPGAHKRSNHNLQNRSRGQIRACHLRRSVPCPWL